MAHLDRITIGENTDCLDKIKHFIYYLTIHERFAHGRLREAFCLVSFETIVKLEQWFEKTQELCEEELFDESVADNM